MSRELLLLIILAIPLVAALASFTFRLRRPLEFIQVAATAGILLVASLLIKEVLVGGPVSALGGNLYLDELSSILIMIIGGLGFILGVYSIGYLDYDIKKGEIKPSDLGLYYGLYHLFLFTMLLTVLSNNIFIMWAAVEATTLASAFLVGFYRHRSSAEGAWKYVLICSAGIAFALFGTVLIFANAYQLTGQVHEAVLWTEVLKVAGELDQVALKMAFVFILIGFGTKAGLVPMHTWLPDAHSEAPSPASALLSGVLLNCGLLLVIRYYTLTGQAIGFDFPRTLLLFLGLASVVIAPFFILVQKDLKRMLAYSSIENMGIIAFGLGIGGPAGIMAALIHTVNHSATKALMFGAAGNIVHKFGTRNTDKIKGVLKIAPVTGVLLIVGALSLGGSPPFAIFVSELLTVTAALKEGYLVVAIIFLAVLAVVFSAMLHFIVKSVFGTPLEGKEKGDLNLLMLAPLVALLVIVLTLGIGIPEFLNQLLERSIEIILGG